MNDSVISRIQAFRQMSVAQLQDEWFRLYGEPTRSRNRDYLWKRLAWRVQELTHGGLSDRARDRIDQLAPDGFTHARTPNHATPVADPEPKPQQRPTRDPRLPSPGTILSRQYHGREIRVLVLKDGFEWDGQHYGSLSAVARAVTGQKWNGRLFFGLTKRRRRR
jgi:hypothetical protein